MLTRRTIRGGKTRVSVSLKLLLTLSVVTALIGQAILPAVTTVSAAGTTPAARNLNQRPVPNFDINLTKYSLRLPSPSQLQALDALKLNLNDSSVTARWDKKTGSLDTLMDFASAPSTLDPEAAARAFIQVNSAIFGITDPGTLRLKSNYPAFGGNLLYFEQTYMGLPVSGAGIGVVMDKERRVKMVSGPYIKDINLGVTPTLTGAIAVAKAKADLAQFKKVWIAGVAERLKGALDTLTKQLGAMAVPSAVMNVTGKVQVSRTAFVSANGKTEFDQTIKNTGANIYTPVEFRVVSISDPTVAVANADNSGSGRGTSPASFYYTSALATNQVSAPRRLVFNNPNKKPFTFEAVVTARVQVAAAQATRYQPPPSFDANFTTATFKETFTGVVPVGDTGLQLADGVTYVDVPFTSKDGAQSVTGALATTTGVDLDMELRDSAGRVLASGATDSASESVTAAIQPNTAYVYRVVGWLGVAQDFQLVSTQTLRVPKTGTTATASTTTSGGLTPYVRFSVNPLTGAVIAQLLQ